MDRQKAQAEKDRTAAEWWQQMEIQQRCELRSNNRARADETKSRDESNTLVATERAMKRGITVDTGSPACLNNQRWRPTTIARAAIPAGTENTIAPDAPPLYHCHCSTRKERKHLRTSHRTRSTEHILPHRGRISNSGANSAEVLSESNSWVVESDDVVVVGRPPAFPSRLLDWDHEDPKKREEVVAYRQRRLARDRTLDAGVVAKTAITRHFDTALHGLGLRKDEKTDSENGFRPYGSGDKQDSDGQDWVKL